MDSSIEEIRDWMSLSNMFDKPTSSIYRNIILGISFSAQPSKEFQKISCGLAGIFRFRASPEPTSEVAVGAFQIVYS